MNTSILPLGSPCNEIIDGLPEQVGSSCVFGTFNSPVAGERKPLYHKQHSHSPRLILSAMPQRLPNPSDFISDSRSFTGVHPPVPCYHIPRSAHMSRTRIQSPPRPHPQSSNSPRSPPHPTPPQYPNFILLCLPPHHFHTTPIPIKTTKKNKQLFERDFHPAPQQPHLALLVTLITCFASRGSVVGLSGTDNVDARWWAEIELFAALVGGHGGEGWAAAHCCGCREICGCVGMSGCGMEW